MGYLDQDGLTYLWQKIKTALAGKQDAITPGDGLSENGDTLSVSIPVRGIVSGPEWDALSEDEQSKGFWIVKAGLNGALFSPKLTADNAPAPYAATASSSEVSFGSSGAFAAFDDNASTFWANSNGDSNIWIAFDFGSKTKVFGLQMQGRQGVNQLPYTFVVQGSNDGTEWEGILSISDLPVDVPEEIRNFDFPEPVSYRHYRISNMLSHWQDGPKYIGIADVRFRVYSPDLITFVINGSTVQVLNPNYIEADPTEVSLSAQSNATVKLSNSALDLSSIQTAPVTAAAAGVEIAGMEEV